MKRYKMIYVEEIVEHEEGKWVPAEVAQALYEALKVAAPLACDSYYIGDDDREIIFNALSLADGGE